LEFGGTQVSIADAVGSSVPSGVNQVLGTAGDDRLEGTSGSDLLRGDLGNDVLIGSSGSDTLDGGEGLDAVRYNASSLNYSLSGSGDTVLVGSSMSGSDSLQNVERLHFRDQSYALDLDGHAGVASRMIVTVFGVEAMSAYLGTVLTFVDQGWTSEMLADLVVDNGLLDSMTGGTTEGFVRHVFENVAGRAPNLLESIFYVDQLNAGVFSESSLLVLASESGLADQQVLGLVGNSIGLTFQEGI